MIFSWIDYNPKTMGYIESWLDAGAVRSTGLDEGFCDFFEYWAKEDGYVTGRIIGAKLSVKKMNHLQ